MLYLFLELFALLKGGDEVPTQVHWREQYVAHLFLAGTMYKNVFNKHAHYDERV